VATVLAFDQAAVSGLDREGEWSAAADAMGDVDSEPESLVLETQPKAEIPEAIEVADPQLDGVSQAAEASQLPPSAMTASASVELPDATPDEASELILQPPADVLAPAISEPVAEALQDSQGPSDVAVALEESADVASGPAIQATIAQPEVESTAEVAAGLAEETPLEAEPSIAAWPDAAAESEPDVAAAAVEMAPTGIFGPIAHGDDDDQQVPEADLAAEEVDERDESDGSQDLPGLAAAAAGQIPDSDAELFPMPAMAEEPAHGAAPIAALEGFLQKISARRLHLTPGSVA
jgi:hypothetical protein